MANKFTAGPDSEKLDWEKMRREAAEGDVVSSEAPFSRETGLNGEQYEIYTKPDGGKTIITEELVKEGKQKALEAAAEERKRIHESIKPTYASAWVGSGERDPEVVRKEQDAFNNASPFGEGKVEPRIAPEEQAKTDKEKTTDFLGSYVVQGEDRVPVSEYSKGEWRAQLSELVAKAKKMTGGVSDTSATAYELSKEILKAQGSAAAESVKSVPGHLEKAGANVREKASGLYEKSKTYISNRSKILGALLTQQKLAILADVTSVREGARYVQENPLEALKAAGMGAREAGKYVAYFANRNVANDEKLAKLKTDLTVMIEGYNKQPAHRKLALSLALATGGGLTAAMPMLHGAALAGISAQRTVASAGFGLNRRTGLEAKLAEGKRQFVADAEWKKNTYVGVLTAAYFAGTSLGVYRLSSWIGHALGLDGASPDMSHTAVPSGSVHTTVPETGSVSTAQSPDLSQTMYGDVHTSSPLSDQVPHGAVIAEHPPYPTSEHAAPYHAAEVPQGTSEISVEVRPGRGYEQMIWDLHHHMHDPASHFDPKTIQPGSDLEKIWNATDSSIQRDAHLLASNPNFLHGAPHDAKVLVGAHMSFDANGNLAFTQGGHDASIAEVAKGTVTPQSAPPVPELRPDHVAGPLEVPPAPPVHEVAAASAPVTHPEVLPPTPEHNFSGRTEGPVQYGKGAHIPLQNATGYENAFGGGPDAAANAAGEHVTAAGHEVITNHFGTHIPVAETHIYQSPDAKHLFAYGGTPEEQGSTITQYLTEHHDAVVYGTDNSGTYRIPFYRAANGEIRPGLPIRTGGMFGFFSNFMKAPSPEELRSLIK